MPTLEPKTKSTAYPRPATIWAWPWLSLACVLEDRSVHVQASGLWYGGARESGGSGTRGIGEGDEREGQHVVGSTC